jgi:SOS-response transcriptional repressor LexA
MISWEERIERIKEACSIKNNKQLEERLGLANGYINDLLKGKNKNPGKLAAALMKNLGINPMWFEDESLNMFGQIDFEKFTVKSPLIEALEAYIKDVTLEDFSLIKLRLNNIERLLGLIPAKTPVKASYEESLTALQHEIPLKKGSLAKDPGDFTADPEPEYDAEKRVEVPYVRNIAAGPPIAQSEDQTERVSVPARFIRKGFLYYAASIRGGSMAEAGIRDGDMVLIRLADTPRDGAVQVVRYQGKSTLKRLRETEEKGWELHYEDGSGTVIPVNSGDYEVQGEFVAILPGTAVPDRGKKGPQRHEKPLENR